MTKSKPQPATPFTEITLIAKPSGVRARRMTDCPLTVVVQVVRPRDEDDYVIVQGFSACVVPLDTTNAFDRRHLADVIGQFEEINGRGWRYVAVATTPVVVR